MIEDRYYIDKIKLSGFRTIYNLNLKLRSGLNIIIGPNGAGKSNFLKALEYVAFLRYPKIIRRRVFQYLDFEILYRNYSDTKTYKLTSKMVKKGDTLEDNEIKFTLDKTIEGDPVHHKEVIKQYREKANRELPKRMNDELREFLKYGREIDNSATFIPYSFEERMLLLDDELKYSYNVEIKQFINSPETVFWHPIRSLGILVDLLERNISRILESIKIEDKDINDSMSFLVQDITNSFFDNGIKRFLKKFTPIKDIRLSDLFSTKLSSEVIVISNLKLQFLVYNQWIHWDYLSDGTKRMFYLVLEVLGNDNLVLIEEPELGVHPSQLNLIMEFLKEQSIKKQIILSTHAPTTLNILEKNEIDRILIAKWDSKNYTKVDNMSDIQIKKICDFVKTKGLLSDYWIHHDMEV